MRESNVRDFVIRFLFYEFLVCQADTNMLARACQEESIDSFLRKSSVQFLEDCIKFFKAFYEGRNSKLYLLRNAICDYLLDLYPQSSSIAILGARVVTENVPQKMDPWGWDILLKHFHDIVGWWNLHSFAFRFEDLVMVRVLIACRRYESVDGSTDDIPSWQAPDEDVSQENVSAVPHSFIAVTKGFFDPESSGESKKGIAEERQTRSYLVGRMSRQDPWARKLAQELSERIGRLQILVYGRDNPVRAALFVSLSGDQNPWVKRTRSALTKEALRSQEWTVELSLENILDDLELMYSLANVSMARDYYEFIIIERFPNRKFDLAMVVDALAKLKGDMGYIDIWSYAI
ncbi:hypothetical protein RRF57_005815 [Xylaria bambusicola]|uniref:Uncharacterized protein n=1 Tax=Xylaria bambusicola TaxID=326684 RepID=A0AAN7UD93_9PEZI